MKCSYHLITRSEISFAIRISSPVLLPQYDEFLLLLSHQKVTIWGISFTPKRRFQTWNMHMCMLLDYLCFFLINGKLLFHVYSYIFSMVVNTYTIVKFYFLSFTFNYVSQFLNLQVKCQDNKSFYVTSWKEATWPSVHFLFN